MKRYYVNIFYYHLTGWHNFYNHRKNIPMLRTKSSKEAKKLVLSFILENIDYRKRCLYLQEIISLGRINDVWRKALAAFFDTPMQETSVTNAFSKN